MVDHGPFSQEAKIPTETGPLTVAQCRNCGGEEWVCENHEDTPWNADGCECGAGAPCPVCNRRLACAPYIPQWERISSWDRERHGETILASGGHRMDETTSLRGWFEEPDFVGLVTRAGDHDFSLWRGENAGGHDEFYWHRPTHFMPLPVSRATAVAMMTKADAASLPASPSGYGGEDGVNQNNEPKGPDQ